MSLFINAEAFAE